MLEKSIKDHLIVIGAYAQWIEIKYGRKEAMNTKVMDTKLKYKVDEISSSATSASNGINELQTYVASKKKSDNTNLSKLGSLAKK